MEFWRNGFMPVSAASIGQVMTAFVLQSVLILEAEKFAVGFAAFVFVHVAPILHVDPMNNLHIDFLICMSMRLSL